MFLSASQLAKSYSPLDIPESGREPFTNYSWWRLLVNDGGRHTWHYLKTEEERDKWPQNYIDKYWTGQPLVSWSSLCDTCNEPQMITAEPPRPSEGDHTA